MCLALTSKSIRAVPCAIVLRDVVISQSNLSEIMDAFRGLIGGVTHLSTLDGRERFLTKCLVRCTFWRSFVPGQYFEHWDGPYVLT
jgi:hypothetical protein